MRKTDAVKDRWTWKDLWEYSPDAGELKMANGMAETL